MEHVRRLKAKARKKRHLPKRKNSAKKIAFFVLAALVFGIVSVLLFAIFQRPAYVNKNLVLQNKLHVPSVLQPRVENGEKVFDLTAQYGQTEFLPGKRTDTMGFNGNYLGPTIRARTGDKVRLNVTNNLRDLTTTHWHGMHLPAVMDGNAHQPVKPSETWRPHWTITNQAAPLWYHPHLLGKTGEQVYRGLAGMFIIDDQNSDLLALPKNYGVDDIPLIVQDKEFDRNGQFVYKAGQQDILGHTGMPGDKILVNGTYAPYVEVPAGHVRLRLVNGSNARRYDFAFDDHRTFQQVATDGGFLNAPVTRTSLILSPGERAEVVVNLAGQTKPLTLMSNALREDNGVLRVMKNVLSANRDENQIFKILELRPQSTSDQPVQLPQALNTIKPLQTTDATKTRRFVLGDDHTINGKEMDHMRVDEVVRAGDVEIWEVNNQTGTYHPFHIHGVQFQVLDRGGKPPEDFERGWKDTVLVQNNETVRVITRFPEFTDPHVPYMFHCHILEHEDMGMMGQFMVVGKDTKDQDIRVQSEAMPGYRHTH